MHMNLYNSKTRAAMRRAAKRAEETRRKITSSTMMRKTCIVTDHNGREIDRLVVECPASDLSRRYSAALDLMLTMHPRSYIFCDHSEGVAL